MHPLVRLTALVLAGLAQASAHAQAQLAPPPLTLDNAQNCTTTVNGFTVSGNTLHLDCGKPSLACDRTKPGFFSFQDAATTSGSGTAYASGSVYTGITIKRTGGCLGQYTITYGTYGDGLRSYSPVGSGSVYFADGDAMPKTVAVIPGYGANLATPGTLYLWLTGYQSDTGSPAPPIAGGYVLTVLYPLP